MPPQPTPSLLRRRQRLLLLLAVSVFAAAAMLFMQFQKNISIVSRVAIPNNEIEHADGLSCRWKVPATLQAAPWCRASIRMYENNVPLPLRVENSASVAQLGKGRFGAAPFSVGTEQRETVWFSATDNTNPATNNRTYEFEVHSQQNRLAIYPVLALALGAVFIISALRASLKLAMKIVFAPHRKIMSGLTLFLALGGFCLFLQGMPGKALSIESSIPSFQVSALEEGAFQFRLPRGFGHLAILSDSIVYEDGVAFKLITETEVHNEVRAGTCYRITDPPRIIFHPRDGSSPMINGRTYSFRASIVEPDVSFELSIFLMGLAGIAFCSSRPKALDWKWILVAAALFKLWVVASSEVLAQDFDPLNYAYSTIAMVWGEAGLPRNPGGFPFIAGLVSQFGVPWRLAVEMLFLSACGMLACVIAEVFLSRIIGSLVFCALAWHPWTFSGFANFMPVPIVLVLMITLIAIMFRFFNRFDTLWNWSAFVGMGLFMFLWQWSRNEDPLVYSCYVVFAILVIWLSHNRSESTPWSRRVCYLVLPLCLVFVLGTGVKAINYAQFGVNAKSQIDMPGLMALMKVLYKVKTEKEIRYAPVTRQTLEAVCEVSPTLQKYKDTLLDPSNPNTLCGEKLTKLPGEFGPWLNWLLPDSLPGTPEEKDALMMMAAVEVSGALRSGRLTTQSAWFPLDPNWRLWLPDFLPCVANVLRQATSMQPWRPLAYGTENQDLMHVYDKAANRRMSEIRSSENSPSNIVGVDVSPKMQRLLLWEARSAWICGGLTTLLLVFTFFEVLLKKLWHGRKIRVVFACWMLVSIWLLGRVFLYGLLAANVGWWTEMYMRPIAPLFILALLYSTAMLAFVLRTGMAMLGYTTLPKWDLRRLE